MFCSPTKSEFITAKYKSLSLIPRLTRDKDSHSAVADLSKVQQTVLCLRQCYICSFVMSAALLSAALLLFAALLCLRLCYVCGFVMSAAVLCLELWATAITVPTMVNFPFPSLPLP